METLVILGLPVAFGLGLCSLEQLSIRFEKFGKLMDSGAKKLGF